MRLASLLAVAALAACGSDPLLDALHGVPGLQVSEQATSLAGYRFFHLQFEQPVDHDAPAGAHFLQRATLLHRDFGAPTVVTSSGYFVSQRDYLAEVTSIVDGNQLNLEHRYFAPSRPVPADWSLLNIRQAAYDYHRIIGALRQVYPRAMVTTGGSKGGMAAVYHRRFFPGDVAGTVAYVAPQQTAPPDDRYERYIDDIGRRASDPTCGTRLRAYQRLALSRADALVERAERLAGLTFQHLGTAVAVEHALLELPFYFWQYGDERSCVQIPASGASDDELFQFLNTIHPLSEFTDQDISDYQPYYYQSGTQLGWPAFDEAAVADLLRAPGTYVPQTYLPKDQVVSYEPAAMAEVQDFVARRAEHLLLIYGQNDPWSAAPFTIGQDAARRDVELMTVPGGNHGARIAQLAEPDNFLALTIIQSWVGGSLALGQRSAALRGRGAAMWPWPRRERPER